MKKKEYEQLKQYCSSQGFSEEKTKEFLDQYEPKEKRKLLSIKVLTIISLAVVCIIMGLIFSINIKMFLQESTNTDNTAPFNILLKPIITYDEYLRVQNGMTYKQVFNIIGVKGQETGRNFLDGVPGVMDSIETVVYQWINNDGSNAIVMLLNDKVVQKSQFGLK